MGLEWDLASLEEKQEKRPGDGLAEDLAAGLVVVMALEPDLETVRKWRGSQ